MSQVLVGEIVFKLKADADNLVRTLRKAAAEVRALEAAQKRLEKAASENNQAIDRQTKAQDRVNTAMTKSVTASNNLSKANDRNTKSINTKRIALGALIAVLAKTAAKIALLASVGGLALAAVGALAGGVVMLANALAPLLGALVLYPAALGAVASSMLLLKTAMGPVMEALKNSGDLVKYTDALKRMNTPAQDVTTTLYRMKNALDATNVIQRSLFPGINEGLILMSRGIPNVQRGMAVLGQSLGRVATFAGQVFGSRGFLSDFNTIAQTNANLAEKMGRGIVLLGSAFRRTFTAATPLINAAGTAFEDLARKIDNAAALGRSTGSLDAFFYRTLTTSQQLGESIGDLGMGLRNLAKYAGMGGLDGLEKMASQFRAFTESVEGQNSIRQFFNEVGPALSEFGKLIADVGRAMADFAKKGDLVNVLSKLRTELLPSLVKLGDHASKRLIPALIDLATAFTNIATTLSAGAMGQLLVLAASGLERLSVAIAAMPDVALLVGSFISLTVAGQRMAAILGGTVVASFVNAARAMVVAGRSAATAGAGFRAGLAGVGAAAGGMRTLTTLAGAAAIVLGSKMVNAWRDSKESIKEFISVSESAFDPARLNFEDVLTPLREMKTELDNTGFSLYDFTFGLDDLPGKLQKIGPAWLGMGDGIKEVNRAIEEQEQLSRKAASNISFLGEKYDLTEAQVKRLAEQLGIDLRDGAMAASREIDAYNAYLGDGAAQTTEFADAVATLGDEFATATDRASAMKQAMDAFANVDLTQLAVDAKNAFADLAETMQENGTALDATKTAFDINSQAGRDNWEAMKKAAEGIKEVTAESQKQGKSAQETDAIYQSFRQQLIDTAAAAGLGAEAAKFLAENFGLIPELVEVIFKTEGLEEAHQMAENMDKSIRAIEKSDPEVKFKSNDSEVKASIRSIEGSTPEFQVLADTAAANAETKAAFDRAQTQATMPVDANTGAAIGQVHGLRNNITGITPYMPVDANTRAGRSQIAALRALASMGVTMPVTVRVSGASYLAEVRRDASRARNFSANANGNIYKAFANGSENHLAEIAPAGAWRVWAEDETGGEAYIPLALSKRRRSMDILKKTAQKMGASVTQFAKGGFGRLEQSAPTSPTAGMSAGRTAAYQIDLAIGSGDVAALKWAISSAEQIQTAWERTVQQAATAAARADLVERRASALAEYNNTLVEFRKGGTVTTDQMDSVAQAANDALKAINEFDAEQVRAGERRAFEASQARAQAALTIAANKEAWEFAKMSALDQIRFLDRKIAAEQEFSDEWMRLQSERTSVLEREIDRRNRIQEEEIRKAQDRADELAQISDDLNNDYKSALSDLNNLLDREADLRTQMADEQARHAEANNAILDQYNADRVQAAKIRYDAETDALARYNETVDQLLAERHSTLMSWSRIDAQADALTALPVAWINANVKEQIAQFQQWSQMLASARDRGVSEDVIAALGLDAGPQALGQLQAMAAATDAEIAELNALVLAQTRLAGEQVQREVGIRNSALNTQLVAATQVLVDEMAEALVAFDTSMAEAFQTMEDNLEAELTTYTERLGELEGELANLGLDTGRTYTEAIAAGMASGLPGIIEMVAEVEKLAKQAEDAAKAAAAAAGAVPTYTPVTSITKPNNSLPGGSGSPFKRPGTITGSQGGTPGLAYPGAPPRGTAGTVVIAGTTYTVNTAGIIDSPGKYYGIYPTQATFDKGGVLSPGLTMAYNATGRNEYVNTGDQILDMALKAVENARGSEQDGPISVNVYLDGTLINNMARAEVNRSLSSLRREVQSGRKK